MSLDQFFDRIYIINLPERQDRRQSMEKNLKRIGWSLKPEKIEFFPAIKPSDAGKFPSIGARGCFSSHFHVLKKAQNDGLKNVLIMEDDLNISDTLIEHEQNIVAQLQDENWDLVYFGHVEKLPVKSEVYPPLIPYKKPIMTAHFYGVNNQAFDRLISYLELVQQRPGGHPEGGSMHLDGAYSTFRAQNPDIVTLIAQNSLGYQRSSRSDIAENQWYDRLPVLRDLVGVARQGKQWIADKNLKS